MFILKSLRVNITGFTVRLTKCTAMIGCATALQNKKAAERLPRGSNRNITRSYYKQLHRLEQPVRGSGWAEAAACPLPAANRAFPSWQPHVAFTFVL
jgi:hypothetical protein